MPTVVAIVTAYQRPEELQQSLQALKNQKKSPPLELSLAITLDQSPDLTQLVKSLWPTATVLFSSKPLYWGGGTNLAWKAAQKNPPDAYLLLNQDTTLYPEALATLWKVHAAAKTSCLVAGKTYDPQLHQLSYGGWEFVPGPLKPIAKFHPHAAESSMANGNILLIPEAIRKKVGYIDDKLPHLFGDFDYTLRAKKLGIPTLLPAPALGECRRQPKQYSASNPWHRLTHPTQLCLGPKTRFLWRHQKTKVPAQVLKTLINAFFPPQR
jgi:GT2 family glycosyltransferase